jgi:lipopolysaccharide/colanic/teichoic acid biosynthesis glycosyltransferase
VYKRLIKRLLDLILSIIALPFVALALAIVAPFIHFEDGGTVFYNAPRIGRGGRPFTMFKLRTMRMDAPDLKMADGSTYNAPDDPRQTRLGGFLRKTSLDELPQIFNVLKGDMSLIGPRPDLAEEVAAYHAGEERKLSVRPGISGYAQVFGRNALAWHDRLALDAYYVDHLCFSLDARIFFRTFIVVFAQEGVYVEKPTDAGGGAGAGGAGAADSDAAGPDAFDPGAASPAPHPDPDAFDPGAASPAPHPDPDPTVTDNKE